MKKYLIMVLILLMICGCSNEYNLTIENDKIIEDIDVVIPKSMIYANVENERNPETYVESDDQITPFLKNDQYALENKKYNKDVTEDNDNYYVNLNYVYQSDEFVNGRALTHCFENITYENERDYYLINLSGRFYCLYGENTAINIKTPNVVKDNNADKVINNTYTWVIDNDNVNDVSISIKILKKTRIESYFLIGLIALSIVTIAIISVIVLPRIIDRKKNNEI